MRQLRPLQSTEMFVGAIVEMVRDPRALLEAAADLQENLHRGTRRPTPWMQRLRGARTGRVSISSDGGVPLFDGRPCCAEQLRRFEGRADLQMPFEVTCPTCDRVFRVRLDIVRRRV